MELNKRSTLFNCAGTAAGLFLVHYNNVSLQLVLLKGQDGNHSNGCLSLMQLFLHLLDFILYFADPNTPSTTTGWFFTKDDKLVALERRRRIGAQLNTREPYTFKKILSFFNTWHIWVFPWLFFCFRLINVAYSSNGFQLWMKMDLKLTSYQYNIYPIDINGGGIGFAIVCAYLNDYFKNNLTQYFLFLLFISGVISYAPLAYWNINFGFKWFCFFFYNIVSSCGQSMVFSWVNKSMAYDNMKRNFLVVSTNLVSYIFTAWISLVVFNQDDAKVR